MNSTKKPGAAPNTTRLLNRAVTRLLSATLVLGISGLFALPVAAQQVDAPDTIQTFPSGHGAWALAFDGANIWVTDYEVVAGSVTKLRASDGALLGTFRVGSDPIGITFDGANIWVANQGDNTVTKLRASDGATLGTFSVGESPYGMTFDGENVWVANSFDKTVTKIRPSDGTVLGTFPAGLAPNDLAFDGTNIWA